MAFFFVLFIYFFILKYGGNLKKNHKKPKIKQTCEAGARSY